MFSFSGSVFAFDDIDNIEWRLFIEEGSSETESSLAEYSVAKT